MQQQAGRSGQSGHALRFDALRFDAFMHLALYHPVHGYYSRGEAIFANPDETAAKAGGDFITAPEISPLFGQALGQALRGAVSLCGGQLWEFGAGRGKLAAALLNALGDEVESYCIVDVSAGLKPMQDATIAHLAPAHHHKVRWVSELPEVLQGVVIGNEVLDAMPVRLWRWYSTGVQELFVGTADTPNGPVLVFEEREAEPDLRDHVLALHARQGPWPEGYQSEWGEQACAFVSTLTERFRGIALMVDYGFPEAEFYHPQRSTGTLVAHRRHQMHAEVLTDVGLQDLTAHVDFSATYEAQAAVGGELLGYCSQAQLLLGADILSLAQEALTSSDTVTAVRTKQALNVLLSEAEMGELFKVMAWCKGVEPDDTLLATLLLRTDRSRQL